MEIGSNKSLFTLIAIVIFGIFLSLSYWLFQDEMKNVLANVMDKTSEMTSKKLDNNGLIPTEDNFFTISTSGKITSYDIAGGTSVVIPAYINGTQVTTISGDVFYNKGLTSLSLPSTLTTIENGTPIYDTLGAVIDYRGAFMGNKLTSLTIPSSVTTIGLRAFMSNPIKDLTLNNGLITIGTDAFHGNKIETLSIPNTVKTISWHAFGSNRISTLFLGSGLKTIGPLAFNGNLLTKVTVPESVQSLGYLWLWKNPITEINFPSSLNPYIDSHPNAISNNGTYTKETGYIMTSYYDSSLIHYY